MEQGDLPHLARQFLIHLGSVSGPIYENDSERASICETMFNGMMMGVIATRHPHLVGLGQPPPNDDDDEVAERRGRELLDWCQLLLRTVSNYQLRVLACIGDPVGFVRNFACLTRGVCKVAGAATPDGSAQAVALESLDHLMDTWVVLLTDPAVEDAETGNLGGDAADQAVMAVVAALKEEASGVFEEVVLQRLHMAEAVIIAGIDDSDEHEDPTLLVDKMQAAACVARANPQPAMALLQQLIEGNVAKTSSPDARIELIHEELFWLILFTGTSAPFLDQEHRAQHVTMMSHEDMVHPSSNGLHIPPAPSPSSISTPCLHPHISIEKH